jgi:hypothetical protein
MFISAKASFEFAPTASSVVGTALIECGDTSRHALNLPYFRKA